MADEREIQVNWQIENLRGTIDLAKQSLKSLELLNGGAAIALLTFYGNVLSRSNATIPFDKAEVARGLLSFGIGLGCGLLATILAYVSQLIAATTQSKSEVHVRIGAILFGLASAVAFILGTLYSASSFGARL
jgi:hypothetical protein